MGALLVFVLAVLSLKLCSGVNRGVFYEISPFNNQEIQFYKKAKGITEALECSMFCNHGDDNGKCSSFFVDKETDTCYCSGDHNTQTVTLEHGKDITIIQPLSCGPPDVKANTSVVSGSNFYLDKATYKCDAGLMKIAGDFNRTCKFDGQWNGTALECALCPTGYHHNEHGCFKFEMNATFDDAETHCQADGAHLVTIDSEAKNEALLILMESIGATEQLYWIGGHQVNDVWTWVANNAPFTYTNWLLVGSNLLTQQRLDQIQQWTLDQVTPSHKHLSLLYSATRDGMSGEAFHTKSDLQGPTVSIGVSATDGNMYGGYTSTDWNAGLNGQYSSDADAFIFQICDVSSCTAKVNVHPMLTSDAIFNGDAGPQFGSQQLFFFSSSTITYDTVNHYFNTDGRCFFDEGTGPYNSLHLKCGSWGVKWRDVEVFKVKDSTTAQVTNDCMALRPGDKQWIDWNCSDNLNFICEI